jgi:rhamnosyltransferase
MSALFPARSQDVGLGLLRKGNRCALSDALCRLRLILQLLEAPSIGEWNLLDQKRTIILRVEMLSIIVPTLNAMRDWPRFAPALLDCVRPEQVLIVDSASTDRTVELAREAGFAVCSIAKAEFNHGGTRQRAAAMLPDAEILLYLTQDAVLAGPDEVKKLLAAFENPRVAAVYGRQLPRVEAGAIEAHARLFNYPAVSNRRELDSREQFGFKSIFISNSFAAYRRSALMHVGGFPSDVIFGEDTIIAAKLLLAGHSISYVAGACVHHSHSYTWIQEFERYFDIGVLHSRERWLLEMFGGASGEGKRFVLSELKYLRKHDAWQIPQALVRTGLKLLGCPQN